MKISKAQLPPKRDVLKAIRYTKYDLANSYLYKLCKDNFTHDRAEKTLAKTILIGRAYAVAIERRKNKHDKTNEEFYQNEIVPLFRKPFLDNGLQRLKGMALKEENLFRFLNLHYKLVKHLNGITELNKRSFVSKYFHFHLKDKFFIYDSRAEKAIRKLNVRLPGSETSKYKQVDVDDKYMKFFLKCFALQKAIKKYYKINLTIRQLDNLFLYTLKDNNI
jgi:hypothetical protein